MRVWFRTFLIMSAAGFVLSCLYVIYRLMF
jgi:hypothetical protein